jgi:hypothetical protein
MIERFDVTARNTRRFRILYIGEGETSPNFHAVTATTDIAGYRGDQIEVYDLTYADDPRFTPDGQFTGGRYYVDTVLGDRRGFGIDLAGGVAEWSIDANTWDDVIVWLSLLRSRCSMVAP